jgi:hypothetical protein
LHLIPLIVDVLNSLILSPSVVLFVVSLYCSPYFSAALSVAFVGFPAISNASHFVFCFPCPHLIHFDALGFSVRSRVRPSELHSRSFETLSLPRSFPFSALHFSVDFKAFPPVSLFPCLPSSRDSPTFDEFPVTLALLFSEKPVVATFSPKNRIQAFAIHPSLLKLSWFWSIPSVPSKCQM